jgi:hypothetical protein
VSIEAAALFVCPSTKEDRMATQAQRDRFNQLLAEYERELTLGAFEKMVTYGLHTGVVSEHQVRLICVASLAKMANSEMTPAVAAEVSAALTELRGLH